MEVVVDPDELLKLLDLGAKPAPPAGATTGTAPTTVGPDAAPIPAGPTALALDAWGVRRGRDLVAKSDRPRTCGTDAFAAADFFGCAFDPDPTLTAACS